jgi:hypothetical protein
MKRYEYTIDADETFPNRKVDLPRLTQEIQESAITIALNGPLTVLAGNCCIDFKVVLPLVDQAVLDQLVTHHSGEPLPNPHMLSDGTPVVALKTMQDNEIPLVVVAPRKGNEWVVGSHNFADPCSWFGDSKRSVTETLVDSGNGLVFNSAHTHWIDMLSGRMHNDSLWIAIQQESNPLDPHGYQVEVRSNGVHMVMREVFENSGGDYEILWEEGSVRFFESQAGKQVTASYSYADGSTFYIRPRVPGTSLVIEDAEADISLDAIMTDEIVYSGWYFNPEINDWSCAGENSYIRAGQIITEARGSYPICAALGANPDDLLLPLSEFRRKSRGMRVSRQATPFSYATIRTLPLGTELRLYLRHHRPFGGEHVSMTFYCTEV